MQDSKRHAFRLIILFGIISLLGDMIYEGARSVNGPYLKALGAGAAVVGLVAGIGEFLGYAARLLSGFLTDKTKAYWLITIIGYAFLLSVPMLGIAEGWEAAALFILMERFGKAIRSPSKQTILSQAAKQVGTGYGFALHEAMDQLGAMLGPLVYSAVFFAAATAGAAIADYQKGYLFSIIPYILLLATLFYSYYKFRNSWAFGDKAQSGQQDKLGKTFWLYNIFTFLSTFGFVNFLLIGYHIKAAGLAGDAWIPLAYTLAMGVDAVAALIIGKAYDRLKSKSGNEKSGLKILIAIPLFTVFIPALVFSPTLGLIIAGIVLWGIVMGTHETIMKASIADITSLSKRGTGYGIFNTSYGLAVMFGSAAAGFLYDTSITLLVAIMSAVQVLAVVSYYYLRKSVV